VNKVILEMTLEEASSVILALIEAQKGYTDGPAIPERILNLRQIITNLDKSMEDCVNNK
jgi:hypothetical protein